AEDNNVPDGFKFGGPVSEATIDVRMSFIRKVYSIVTVQLLLTVGLLCLSIFSSGYHNWIQSNSWTMWVSLFGAIGFMVLTFGKSKSYPTNMIFLGAFTTMEAYSISVITSFYESRIVIEALVIALAVFMALAFLLARPSTTS
ncbi:hypothetical protein LTR43_012537, partial [Exophiala xenobiotica]